MTDEMRAAEVLVRELAPPGLEVPIPEPLAIDESSWFLTAVDKGLIEFSSCTGGCECARADEIPRRDHFETDKHDPHHLFDGVDAPLALRRSYLPCIAAYARAVLELGYDADRASLLRQHEAERCFADAATNATAQSDADFVAPNGDVHLQIVSSGDRQTTRKLATALDACGSFSALPAGFAPVLRSVMVVRPRHMWVVGPNAVDPSGHVFSVRVDDDDALFRRIDEVPSPV
jgi:hypothetical protein